MKKHIVLGAGSAVAASACMALFGTGIASADDYAGMTYAEAQEEAGDTTLVVAGRVGDKLDQDDCIASRSGAVPDQGATGSEPIRRCSTSAASAVSERPPPASDTLTR